MHTSVGTLIAALTVFGTMACQPTATPETTGAGEASDIQMRLASYQSVKLETDLSGLSEQQKRMIPLLVQAAKAMNPIFWQEAYGDPQDLFASIRDEPTRRFAQMNFGPWDRLDGNHPFVDGFGPKPAGANLYPHDVTVEELEAADDPEMTSLYTVVRRGADGSLVAIPYHEAFAEQVQLAADRLRQAAALAEDPGFRRYLELRADALLSDRYQESDFAWMDMKDNAIDLVIGPIETYEDQLMGAKASHEAYLLLKDRDWSARLARYATVLSELQRGLPVDAAYKSETPGTDADLNAYDLLYVAGDGNTGSKTIAINLPNDEQVQLQRGTRRIQIKNAMRFKFEGILEPIADELIASDQRPHVTFDAFFANTMFHEVAHGLGIKNTIDGSGTVRNAMREQASWLEEGKADILGLYMVTKLHEQGELEGDLMDYYVTFFCSIFRSIRFGASSAHGRANLVRFNFLKQLKAFDFDEETGRYSIDLARMQDGVAALSRRILELQGNGDRDGAAAFHEQMAVIGDRLQRALDRLADRGIPVDIVYEQGLDGLNP